MINKVGFGTSVMKLFSSYSTHTQTGAMYEVVTGIPEYMLTIIFSWRGCDHMLFGEGFN